MKRYSHRELTKAIESKVLRRLGAGSERTAWVYDAEGRKILRLTIPHIHPGELAPKTQRSVQRDLQLSDSDFAGLIDCTFSTGDFADHVARLASEDG